MWRTNDLSNIIGVSLWAAEIRNQTSSAWKAAVLPTTQPWRLLFVIHTPSELLLISPVQFLILHFLIVHSLPLWAASISAIMMIK